MNRTSLTSLLRGWKRGAGKRLPALLAAGVLAGLLNSCGDNVVETKSESQRIKDATNKTASVSIYIRNGGGTGDISNENVAVEFYGTSGSSYEVQSVNLSTETKGKYHEVFRGGVIFKDVPVGTYAARVSKTEYATYFIENIEVKYDEEVLTNDVLVVKGVAVNANLYPLSATVTGTVSYKGLSKSKASGPANGAKVTLIFDDDKVEHRIFTADVSDGKFSFSGVPASVTVGGKLSASLTDYATETPTAVDLLPGVANPAPASLLLKYRPDPVILFSDISVAADEEITVLFSQDIDELSVAGVKVYGYEGDVPVDFTGGTEVKSDKSVSGSTLTIKPKNGNWQNLDNTSEYKGFKNLRISFGSLSTTTNRLYRGTGVALSVSTSVPTFHITNTRDGKFFIPDGKSPVVVSFSEAIDTSRAVLYTNIIPSSNLKPGSIYSEDLKTITLEPNTIWGSSGTVSFVSLYSATGNVLTLSGPNAVSVVVTADLLRLENDKDDIQVSAIDANIVLKFTKPVNTNKALGQNGPFEVYYNGKDTSEWGGSYKFGYALSGDGLTVTLTPPLRGWENDAKIELENFVSADLSQELSVNGATGTTPNPAASPPVLGDKKVAVTVKIFIPTLPTFRIASVNGVDSTIVGTTPATNTTPAEPIIGFKVDYAKLGSTKALEFGLSHAGNFDTLRLSSRSLKIKVLKTNSIGSITADLTALNDVNVTFSEDNKSFTLTPNGNDWDFDDEQTGLVKEKTVTLKITLDQKLYAADSSYKFKAADKWPSDGAPAPGVINELRDTVYLSKAKTYVAQTKVAGVKIDTLFTYYGGASSAKGLAKVPFLRGDDDIQFTFTRAENDFDLGVDHYELFRVDYSGLNPGALGNVTSWTSSKVQPISTKNNEMTVAGKVSAGKSRYYIRPAGADGSLGEPVWYSDTISTRFSLAANSALAVVGAKISGGGVDMYTGDAYIDLSSSFEAIKTALSTAGGTTGPVTITFEFSSPVDISGGLEVDFGYVEALTFGKLQTAVQRTGTSANSIDLVISVTALTGALSTGYVSPTWNTMDAMGGWPITLKGLKSTRGEDFGMYVPSGVPNLVGDKIPATATELNIKFK